MIPATIGRDEWFRVAAALKHCGADESVFLAWSQTAPDKYDEKDAKRVWDEAGNSEPPVTVGSLIHLAKQYQSQASNPTEILPEPQTLDEMVQQAVVFIDNFFQDGERYELVKTCQKNGKTTFFRMTDDQLRVQSMQETPVSKKAWFKHAIETSKSGAYFVLNPVKSSLSGTSTRDCDIADFRYTLIESDDLTKEEQWDKLCKLNLPVKSIVWSGNKSFHTFVKIDAGDDPELYAERVNQLHVYLKEHQFSADPACVNPSRLSRIPGFYRGEQKQYLAAGEFGPENWAMFESLYLNDQDEAQIPDAIRELEEEFGPAVEFSEKGSITAINQQLAAEYICRTNHVGRIEGEWRLYNAENGLWERLDDPAMMSFIASNLRKLGRELDVNLSGRISSNLCKDIRSFMSGKTLTKPQTHFIHLANGVLEIDETGRTELKPFAPDYLSRNRTEIQYDPQAECPRFLNELIRPAIQADDVEVLQRYSGQCLLGDNLTQTFLLLTGTAGGGKSTLVNIIEKVIGQANCAELRTDQLSQRFETSRFIGKTLLSGKDVKPSFLNTKGADRIKSLCGADLITAELKGQNSVIEIPGCFNIIITSNSKLTLNVESDVDAWRRRLRWVQYSQPAAEHPIPNFDEMLIRQEGPGIINWMIQGACKVLQDNNMPVSDTARTTIEELLRESDAIYWFLSECVERQEKGVVSSDELYRAILEWGYQQKFTLSDMSENKVRRRMKQGIESIFHISESNDDQRFGGYKRCYRGIQLKGKQEPQHQPVVQPIEQKTAKAEVSTEGEQADLFLGM